MAAKPPAPPRLEEFRSDELADVTRELGALTAGRPTQAELDAVFGDIPEIRSILLCLDGSAASQPAIQWAGALARAFGATLNLYTVVPPSPYAAWAQGQKILRDAASLPALRGLKVEKTLDRGSPATRIVAVAKGQGVDLVVLGSGSRRGLQRFVLGSVADAVSHHASCSVLLAKNRPPPKRIVAGADGSKAAAQAVRLALRLGNALSCPTTVLHAHDLSAYGHAGEPRLDPVLRKLEERYPVELLRGVLRLRLTHGRPAQELLDVADAEKAGLLVVGSRGRGGAARRLLGSVGTSLSHRATQAVLIAR